MEERRASPPAGEPAAAESSRPSVNPASLPLPYMSRRRLGQLAALLLAAWLVIAFGRQVADASAATDRAARSAPAWSAGWPNWPPSGST